MISVEDQEKIRKIMNEMLDVHGNRKSFSDFRKALEHIIGGNGIEEDRPPITYVVHEKTLPPQVAVIDTPPPKEEELDPSIIPPEFAAKLRPFQIAGILYAIQKKRTFIADEMGLGKSVQALGVCESKGLYPALIVCPASLKYNWRNEIKKWLPHRTSYILEGQSLGMLIGDHRIKSDADFIICNYDILKNYAEGLKIHGLKMIIYDESHYLKSPEAKRTFYGMKISEKIENMLLLTGTAILNRPQELLTQVKMLRYFKELFGSEVQFNREFCQRESNYGGKIIGFKNLDFLNERLRKLCYIRRNKKDVLTELPDKQRSDIKLEISNREEYAKAEENLISYLQGEVAKDQGFLETLVGFDGVQRTLMIMQRQADVGQRAIMAEHLVRIEVLKQVVARGKLNAVTEWVSDFIESGEKLVLFANHIEIQEALRLQFPDAAHLMGEDSAETRQANVDRFQNDPNCSLIICSLAVGGLGITLTASSCVATMELGWTPAIHDQAEDRVHRIGQKESVNTYYFLGEETIDDDIYQLLEQKRQTVQATLDGKDTVAQVSIFSDLVERLTNRRRLNN